MWKFEHDHAVPTQGSPALRRSLKGEGATGAQAGLPAPGEFKSAEPAAAAEPALADRLESAPTQPLTTASTRRAAMQSLAQPDVHASALSGVDDDELLWASAVGEGSDALLEARARAARHDDRRARAQRMQHAASQADSMEQVARLRVLKGMSAMQRHSDFFDEDKDGEISPWETYRGLRKIGFNLPIAVAGVLLVHLTISWLTRDSWLPDWRGRISIKNIHRCKHGSDTAVYDHEGRMSHERFELVFGRFEREGKRGLRFRDILTLCKRNQEMTDFFGWAANIIEWIFTWWVAQDENGVMSIDSARALYDGTLFYQLEERYSRRAATSAWWTHTLLAPLQWGAAKLLAIGVVERAVRLVQLTAQQAMQRFQSSKKAK